MRKMTQAFLLVALFAAGQIQAGPWVKLDKPKYRGDRLDWCLTFGANCGQPVVNKYCQTLGHAGSQYFAQDPNIGRTRLLTDAVCEDGFCDGFKHIYCRKLRETYTAPRYRGDRLDWCAEFGTQCGKPAADAFCKKEGWSSAYDFAIDQNIGRTRLINDAVCEDSFCDGFKHIRCM